MRLRADDNVLITKGRDRGKVAQVQKVLTRDEKILVEGINMVSRHTKSSPSVRQAGIIQKEMPLPASNAVLICTHCNKPTRVKLRVLMDGTKARTCNNCKEVIE